jgi:hypothetical protein
MDEIDQLICDFELAEYICFLLEFLESVAHDCHRTADLEYCLSSDYHPDHPIMLMAIDLKQHR